MKTSCNENTLQCNFYCKIGLTLFPSHTKSFIIDSINVIKKFGEVTVANCHNVTQTHKLISVVCAMQYTLDIYRGWWGPSNGSMIYQVTGMSQNQAPFSSTMWVIIGLLRVSWQTQHVGNEYNDIYQTLMLHYKNMWQNFQIEAVCA